MSYLTSQGYKNDVFISYAHTDDAPLLGSEKGWVLNFVDDLEKTLAMKLGNANGNAPSIWKDEELAGNKPFDVSLTDAISNTAVYVIIMSPSYLESEWCKKERQQFFDILKKKSADTRVFIVEVDEVDRSLYPGDINKNLIAYRFWQKEKGAKAYRLGMPKRDNDSKYYAQLIEVSTELAQELKKIKQKQVETAPQQAEKGYIFLAEVTDDLDDKREEIKRYLKAEGYKILPEENYYPNYDSISLKEYIQQSIDKCSGYVQLISHLPGKRLPGTDLTIAAFQFNIAKGLENKKKILIWRSPDCNRELLSDAEMKKVHESEFVREQVLERFKAAILDVFSVKTTEESRDSRFVYICTDSVDWSYCEDVIVKKIEEKKIDYSLPLKSKDPANVRKYQEENLLICDAAIFVYCSSEPGILLNQLMHCRKINVKRASPFKMVAIYDGPPPVKDEIKVGFPALQVSYLNCRNNLNDFTEKFLNLL